ncbi:hypothetical protein Tco_0549415 [Tanacetum coccineum]
MKKNIGKDFMEEIMVKWADGKAYIFLVSDYMYLSKNDIEYMHYLCLRREVDYRKYGLLNSLIGDNSYADDPSLETMVIVDSMVEEVVGPDEGTCLVVRRTLNNTHDRAENLQREAIFHTRCTIAQRVCTVIINGGSCTNVASQTLVSKLNLITEPHPSPYVIQWLNQGKGIHVSHRILLSLSIGRSYEDKIRYDVIPMDAFHVLL